MTGQITLDTPQLLQVWGAPGGADAVRAVVQHEVAHVLGLDHVDDATQLMQPTARAGLTDVAAGDPGT